MSVPIPEKIWCYQDYQKLPNEERYEILHGRLEKMAPAPGFLHQLLSSKLGFLLQKFIVEKRLGFMLYAPTDVILAEDNIVQPDILFISEKNKGVIQERGIFGPPDLVVEILSPRSLYKDNQEKLRLYEKYKVQEYWIVDPAHRTIQIMVLGKEEKYQLFSYAYVGENDAPSVQSKILDGLEVELEALFST